MLYLDISQQKWYFFSSFHLKTGRKAMDEKWLDAVFALFGNEDPTQEDLEILKVSGEPLEADVVRVADRYKADDEDVAYCARVATGLQSYMKDPDAYIANLAQDNPRRSGLMEIAAARRSEVIDAPPAPAQALPEAEEPKPEPQPAPAQALPEAEEPKPEPQPVPVDLAMSAKFAVLQPGPNPAHERRVQDDELERRDREDAAHELRRISDLGEAELRYKAEIKKLKEAYDPVTQAHRAWLSRPEWTNLRDAICAAHTNKDQRRLQVARETANGYKAGQRGGSYRLLGQLIDQLLKDLDAGLCVSDPSLFDYRYVED